MTIKHVMRNLPPEKMKEVMAHFNAEEAFFIDFDTKLVLGVHLVPENCPNLKFIEIQGVWSIAEKL